MKNGFLNHTAELPKWAEKFPRAWPSQVRDASVKHVKTSTYSGTTIFTVLRGMVVISKLDPVIYVAFPASNIAGVTNLDTPARIYRLRVVPGTNVHLGCYMKYSKATHFAA